MRFHFVGVLLFWPLFSLAHILIHETLEDHLPLSHAIVHLAERYIGTKTNTLIIMEMCHDCNTLQQNFQCRILDFVLWNFKDSLSFLLHLKGIDNQPWNYHIFIIDSPAAFETQLNQIEFKRFETEFYFLVALTRTQQLTDEQLHDKMMGVFVAGLKLYVINVIIMIQTADGDIILYKSDVFGRDCGDKVLIHRFNQLRDGRLEKDILFPLRMRDFDQCTCFVVSHEMPPLLIFKGDRKNASHFADVGRMDGINVLLLKLITKSLNTRLNITILRDKGTVYDNGTATGCFAMLNEERAHIAVGSFGTSMRNRQFFTASLVYHQSPFIFVVRSGLHYSPIKQLIQPFRIQLWKLIFVTLILGIVSVRFLRFQFNQRLNQLILGNSNNSAILNLFVILLGNPVAHLPPRNFGRFVFMCWILLTFVLRNYYQGKMFDSLRVARRIPLPRTIGELIDRKYFMISREYQDFYPHNLTWVIPSDYPMRYEIVEHADNNARLTGISLFDNLAHYNLMHWNSSRLTMVNDPIYIFQFVMFFKKHARFKFAFDAKLKQLMGAGFVSYIVKRFVKSRFTTMNDLPLTVSQISNEMLYGLYAIYTGAISGAIFVFILEVLSRRNRILRAIFRQLDYFS